MNNENELLMFVEFKREFAGAFVKSIDSTDQLPPDVLNQGMQSVFAADPQEAVIRFLNESYNYFDLATRVRLIMSTAAIHEAMETQR